jgi:hypothetical protein
MQSQQKNDLFAITLRQLHQEAPVELLQSLRSTLDSIKRKNPNNAQTAQSCLDGLAMENCSLMHVLTAAYLINGGVMLKHQAEEQEIEKKTTSNLDEDFDFKELEEELRKFHPEGEPKPLEEEQHQPGARLAEPCVSAWEDPAPQLPPLTLPSAVAGAYLRQHPARQLRQPAFPEPLVRG